MRCLVDGERGLLIDNKRLSSLAARRSPSIWTWKTGCACWSWRQIEMCCRSRLVFHFERKRIPVK